MTPNDISTVLGAHARRVSDLRITRQRDARAALSRRERRRLRGREAR